MSTPLTPCIQRPAPGTRASPVLVCLFAAQYGPQLLARTPSIAVDEPLPTDHPFAWRVTLTHKALRNGVNSGATWSLWLSLQYGRPVPDGAVDTHGASTHQPAVYMV